MSGVAAGFVEILFEPVELLNNRDRNDQIVVLEAEESLWVVQENVGIENVCFFHKYLRRSAASNWRPVLPAIS